MNNINGINSYQGPNIVRSGQAKDSPFAQSSAPGSVGSDQVEISQMARLMSTIAAAPDVRQDKVAAVRKQLADGSYDVSSKLSIALDRMLDEYM